jgi:hypothetical protein
VRCAFHGFALRASNAGKFFHEVGLRRQASGRIGNDNIGAASAARRDGVENNSGRISAALRDHVNLVAFAPDGQLFARGGAEGVGSGKQHCLILSGKPLCDFPDRSGFACTIDAGHHDHQRLGRIQIHGFLRRKQDAFDFIAQCCTHFLARFEALELHRIAQTL